MRIVLVDPPTPVQGTDCDRFAFSDIVWPYATELGKLARRHVNVTVHLVGGYHHPPFIPGVHVVPVPVGPRVNRNSATYCWAVLAMRRAVRELEPTIVHTVDYLAASLLTIAGATIVVTTPGNIQERRATKNVPDPIHALFLATALKHLVYGHAHVVATTPYMARWWEWSGFASPRIHVIPLPVEIDERVDAVSPAALRCQLQWDPSAIHLCMASELRPDNRIQDGFAYFRAVRYKLPNIHLHIFGTGPLLKTLPLADNPMVHYHGRVLPEQLPYYFKAAHALLMPRRFNAVPRVALAALCYGTPVIANLNASLRDLGPEIDDGVHQIDFTRAIPKDAAAVLLRALQLDRRQLADASRQAFSAPKVAAALWTLYEELQTRPGRPPSGAGTRQVPVG
jgi:glycosyltransferase involved in cell wall biosynthesis